MFGKCLEKTKQKTLNPNRIKGFLLFNVLEAGLEPARADAHRILSPACLPIPPLEQFPTGLSGYNRSCELLWFGERETGFEPATPTLARSCSTN